MLVAGGLIIAGIVLMMTLSKSVGPVSTEQAEVDTPPDDSRIRANNPPPTTNNGGTVNPQSSPLLRVTPAASPPTGGASPENIPTSPGAASGERLVPNSFFVPARRYYSMRFNISAQGGMKVVGNFRASGGSGNDIEVIIVDEEGFKNFANKQGARTYYNSGKLSIGNINVRLQSGTYYIIFNNNFSLLSNKTIITEIALKD
jgi:hypothetical protein